MVSDGERFDKEREREKRGWGKAREDERGRTSSNRFPAGREKQHPSSIFNKFIVPELRCSLDWDCMVGSGSVRPSVSRLRVRPRGHNGLTAGCATVPVTWVNYGCPCYGRANNQKVARLALRRNGV